MSEITYPCGCKIHKVDKDKKFIFLCYNHYYINRNNTKRWVNRLNWLEYNKLGFKFSDISLLLVISPKIYQISAKFMLSSFGLLYLKKLNKFLIKKYGISKLTDENKEIEIIETPIRNWITDCLYDLNTIINRVSVLDIEKFIELGNIIELTELELEQVNDIRIYDIIYKFINRLISQKFINEFGLFLLRKYD